MRSLQYQCKIKSVPDTENTQISSYQIKPCDRIKGLKVNDRYSRFGKRKFSYHSPAFQLIVLLYHNCYVVSIDAEKSFILFIVHVNIQHSAKIEVHIFVAVNKVSINLLTTKFTSGIILYNRTYVHITRLVHMERRTDNRNLSFQRQNGHTLQGRLLRCKRCIHSR